jgi:putative acetyltransferase
MITICNEESQDIEPVRQVLRAAFPTDAESRLVDALRLNGKALVSLVAVDKGEVLGHVLFSPVSTAPPNEAPGVGLGPVAVRPDCQRVGIGTTLIRHGLELCRQLEYGYCVVLGDPRYYARFGFEKASRFGMRNEYGVDDEFMLLPLSDYHLHPGLVQYAPEFAELSL